MLLRRAQSINAGVLKRLERLLTLTADVELRRQPALVILKALSASSRRES
jgi:hypothetical protein